jgi:outer membrane lipoprotein-sorting protein
MTGRLLAGVAAVIAAASPAPTPTADELVARNIAARGGRERLKTVQTIRMSGRLSPGAAGVEAPIRLEMKRPDRIRMEITFQGMTAVQAYDGKTGWQIAPFRGQSAPVRMSPEETEQALEQADLDGPLVDYKDKGHAVEFVGGDKVDEAEAWRLKLTLKNGTVRDVYIDAASFLERLTVSKRTIRGIAVEAESRLEDYREVEGMRFPHLIRSGARGRPERQSLTVEKIEINPVLEDAHFRMPPEGKPGSTR